MSNVRPPHSWPTNHVSDVEAAKLLGVSVSTLRRWRYSGTGPKFYGFGSSIRYWTDDLSSYINLRAVDPGRTQPPEAA